MSLWFICRDKTGKRHLWLIDLDVFTLLTMGGLVSVALGVTARLHPEFLIAVSLAAMLGGFLCFGAVKVSLFCRGIWTSWGTRRMTASGAKWYKFGYALMGAGALLFLFLCIVR
jgi:hypothetical protein